MNGKESECSSHKFKEERSEKAGEEGGSVIGIILWEQARFFINVIGVASR